MAYASRVDVNVFVAAIERRPSHKRIATQANDPDPDNDERRNGYFGLHRDSLSNVAVVHLQRYSADPTRVKQAMA